MDVGLGVEGIDWAASVFEALEGSLHCVAATGSFGSSFFVVVFGCYQGHGGGISLSP